jgi:hypothetical protein
MRFPILFQIILWVGAAQFCQADAALVQSKIVTTNANTNTLINTPNSGLTAGNTAVLTLDFFGASRTVSSVVNQSGSALSYVLASEGYDSGNGSGQKLIVVYNIPNGTSGVRVNLSGNAEWGIELGLHEYSGLTTANPLIVGGGSYQQQFYSSGANGLTSGSYNVTSQPALLVGHARNNSAANLPATGSGFTALTTTGLSYSRSEYKRITSTGSISATFTQSQNANLHNVSMVALAEAASYTWYTLPAPGNYDSNSIVAGQTFPSGSVVRAVTSFSHITVNYGGTLQNDINDYALAENGYSGSDSAVYEIKTPSGATSQYTITVYIN